jgi:hypothetical protein
MCAPGAKKFVADCRAPTLHPHSKVNNGVGLWEVKVAFPSHDAHQVSTLFPGAIPIPRMAYTVLTYHITELAIPKTIPVHATHVWYTLYIKNLNMLMNTMMSPSNRNVH